MIAMWGNKEHLTFVFPLRFSHDGPTSSKNVPLMRHLIWIWLQYGEIRSILHVFFLFGSLTTAQHLQKTSNKHKKNSLLSAHTRIYILPPRREFPSKHQKPHAWIREQLFVCLFQRVSKGGCHDTVRTVQTEAEERWSSVGPTLRNKESKMKTVRETINYP